LFGTFSRDGFRIQRRHIFASAFNPHLYGKVEPISGGSRISLHFDLHPIPRFQRAVLVIAAIASVAVFVPAGLLEGQLEAAFYPLAGFAALLGVMKLEWQLRFRDDEAILLQHVERLFRAVHPD